GEGEAEGGGRGEEGETEARSYRGHREEVGEWIPQGSSDGPVHGDRGSLGEEEAREHDLGSRAALGYRREEGERGAGRGGGQYRDRRPYEGRQPRHSAQGPSREARGQGPDRCLSFSPKVEGSRPEGDAGAQGAGEEGSRGFQEGIKGIQAREGPDEEGGEGLAGIGAREEGVGGRESDSRAEGGDSG